MQILTSSVVGTFTGFTPNEGYLELIELNSVVLPFTLFYHNPDSIYLDSNESDIGTCPVCDFVLIIS